MYPLYLVNTHNNYFLPSFLDPPSLRLVHLLYTRQCELVKQVRVAVRREGASVHDANREQVTIDMHM